MIEWIKTADGYTWRGYEIKKGKAWNKTIWFISNNGQTFDVKSTLKEAKLHFEQWVNQDD